MFILHLTASLFNAGLGNSWLT